MLSANVVLHVKPSNHTLIKSKCVGWIVASSLFLSFCQTFFFFVKTESFKDDHERYVYVTRYNQIMWRTVFHYMCFILYTEQFYVIVGVFGIVV